MSERSVLYGVDAGVAVVTLNRPERLNAWTPEMGKELLEAMEQAASDQAVKVVILTGAGRGFCSGMDHANLAKTDENRARQRRTVWPVGLPSSAQRADFEGLFNYFPSIGKPVIAAINGPVAGSGLVLALACDIRFMASDAVLTSAFSRRGLIAEHGIAWLLTHLIGVPKALDLLLSGRKVEAAEAHAMGIVNFICSPGDAIVAAKKYADEMAKNCSPRSLQIIKRQVWNSKFETLQQATDIANWEMLQSFSMPDFKEAQAAYMAGRAPQFSAT